MILSIDPGPHLSGYALIDETKWIVTKHGVASWDDLITMLLDKSLKISGIAMEKIILYSFAKGAARVNNSLLDTVFQCGRLYQKAVENSVSYRADTRANIIKGLTGLSPHGKGNKVSKKDMQDAVQKILKLQKPISPQHANDAVCAGLFLFDHPLVIEAEESYKSAQILPPKSNKKQETNGKQTKKTSGRKRQTK